MKTILIIIAGMADLPDPLTLKETPLVMGHIPSLDILARRGEMTSFPTITEPHEISHKNALLSVLGYDLDRGEPSVEELMEFGLDNSLPLTQYSSLCPFVLPGFSGHGVCVTTSAWVRGVAKCAFLKPIDIYSPGSSDAEILEAVAKLACDALPNNEFVLVYVDSPLKVSLRGDYEGKIKALEQIDRHLITPIADYVWKSDLMINMAVTTDLVTPWHRRRPTKMSVPLILYFNNHDWDGDPEQSFTEVQAMLNERNLNSPSDLMRYLCNFNVSEEEEGE
ncbi:MAG: hypothetical protein J1E16_01095 [Muribaculaceae bacterium]|nr:hypothetical protein [Muribaculaceae bacterium]